MVDFEEGFLPLMFRFISHAGIQMGLDQSASRATESQKIFFFLPLFLVHFFSPQTQLSLHQDVHLPTRMEACPHDSLIECVLIAIRCEPHT